MANKTYLIVEVNNDPFPGAFHTPEDVKLRVQHMLSDMIGHYYPVVHLAKEITYMEVINEHLQNRKFAINDK